MKLLVFGVSVRVSRPGALRVSDARIGGGAGLWPPDGHLTTREVRFLIDTHLDGGNSLFVEMSVGPFTGPIEPVFLEMDLIAQVESIASCRGQYPATWAGLKEQQEEEERRWRNKAEEFGRAKVLAELLDTIDPHADAEPLPKASDRYRRVRTLYRLIELEGVRIGNPAQQARDLIQLIGPVRLAELLGDGINMERPEKSIMLETPDISWTNVPVAGVDLAPGVTAGVRDIRVRGARFPVEEQDKLVKAEGGDISGLRAYPKINPGDPDGPYAMPECNVCGEQSVGRDHGDFYACAAHGGAPRK